MRTRIIKKGRYNTLTAYSIISKESGQVVFVSERRLDYSFRGGRGFFFGDGFVDAGFAISDEDAEVVVSLREPVEVLPPVEELAKPVFLN